jgi:hypothetical protein
MRILLAPVALLVGCNDSLIDTPTSDQVKTVSVDASENQNASLSPKQAKKVRPEVNQGVFVKPSESAGNTAKINDFGNISVENSSEYDVFTRAKSDPVDNATVIGFDSLQNNAGKLQNSEGSTWQRYDQTYEQ